MKIGIIVHSKTGHTMQVADMMKDVLMTSGSDASISGVEVCGVEAANDSENNPDAIQLVLRPDIGPYDVLIVGAPVRGGRLSPVMDAYLQSLSSMEGKSVLGFVTHFFPGDGMGGNQAVARLEEQCGSLGATVLKTGIISWMFPSKRAKSIKQTVDGFTDIIRGEG